MGPTASGKTDVAAFLTQRFDFELISVDAAQVYRGMDIGTAKPDQRFLERFPHHLIDIRNPVQGFSAAEFVAEGDRLIADIRTRGRIPLLVGGTMFYFNALERGLSPLPAADAGVRKVLEQEMIERGVRSLHGELALIDPETAGRIEAGDSQRVQRALEIYRLTGSTQSSLISKPRRAGVKALKLTLFDADRTLLHERIARRFRQMVNQGLVAEVESLLTNYPTLATLPAGRTVGYRQVLACLAGQTDEAAMVEAGIAATRQLAKRQLTWLRQQSGVVWFERVGGQRRSCGGETVEKVVARYLSAHPGFTP